MSLISISFIIPNEEPVSFELNGSTPADVNEVHPDAKHHNTFFEYSGRHDNGQLPTLRSSGPMTHVISALAEMKQVSDSFLTDKINAMYGGDARHSNKNNDNNNKNNNINKSDQTSEEEKKQESVTKKMRLEKTDDLMEE